MARIAMLSLSEAKSMREDVSLSGGTNDYLDNIHSEDIEVKEKGSPNELHLTVTTAEIELSSYIQNSHLSKIKLLKQMFIELMNYRERKLLFFSIFLAICVAILRIVFFIFIVAIINIYTHQYDDILHYHICNAHEYVSCETPESIINLFSGILVILSIMLVLLSYFQSLSGLTSINSFLKRLNCLLCNKIIHQHFSFFDYKPSADLRYLLTTDMKNIRKSMFNIQIIIEYFIFFVFDFIYLFIYAWDIAAIFIAILGIFMLISKAFAKSSFKKDLILKSLLRGAIFRILEIINYIVTIKMFNKEDDESFLYSRSIKKAFKYDRKKAKLFLIYKFWIKLITFIAILFILYYGGILVKHLTIGIIVISIYILLNIKRGIILIIRLSTSCSIHISLFRVFEILNSDDRDDSDTLDDIIIDNHGYIPLSSSIDGDISIENIVFSYPLKHNKLILDDISLLFPPSSVTALVGPHGSGKSTIFKLLLKFYDFQAGKILIDGVSINNYDPQFIRSKIGYIGSPENIHLFEGRSIADNIKFCIKLDQHNTNCFDNEEFCRRNLYFWRKKKSTKQSDIESAAITANIHEFIISLKNGYKTIIGGVHNTNGSGIRLSKSEILRICIARVILLNPQIVLIDESIFDSVSNNSTKYLIQQSLDRIINNNKTVIIIANQLKTLKKANFIYVLNNGKIIQKGKHNQLFKSKDKQYFKYVKQLNEKKRNN